MDEFQQALLLMGVIAVLGFGLLSYSCSTSVSTYQERLAREERSRAELKREFLQLHNCQPTTYSVYGEPLDYTCDNGITVK